MTHPKIVLQVSLYEAICIVRSGLAMSSSDELADRTVTACLHLQEGMFIDFMASISKRIPPYIVETLHSCRTAWNVMTETEKDAFIHLTIAAAEGNPESRKELLRLQ